MGLDANGTRFLLHARSCGVSFADTATIGRQGMHLSARQLQTNLRAFGREASPTQVERLLTAQRGFAETFLEELGAQRVDSFDYSDFEGATHRHDFNQPIGDDCKRRYSAVIDGGSLEHVFAFPTAIKNCMEMVRPGGHFLAIVPANNLMGHGFYQFSPELYFRIFEPGNGYEIQELILCEHKPTGAWYRVADPRSVRSRVTLVNCRATMMMVLARRTADVPIFAQPPLQSDYVSAWNRSGPKRQPSKLHILSDRARGLIPQALQEQARFLWWLSMRRKFRSKHFEHVHFPTSS